MIEPGPKTKGLGILILFGGGRYWSKEYQKNSRKFKICIIIVYKIPYRRARAWPLGRVRRASKGILHTSIIRYPHN